MSSLCRAQLPINRVKEGLTVKGEHWLLSKASHFLSSYNKSFSAWLTFSLLLPYTLSLSYVHFDVTKVSK